MDHTTSVFYFNTQTQATIRGAVFADVPPIAVDDTTWILTAYPDPNAAPGPITIFTAQNTFGLSLASFNNLTLPYGMRVWICVCVCGCVCLRARVCVCVHSKCVS